MQQVEGMEGLRKKTIYLETLENLFHELTQARSISSSGRKLILLGLLYDVHRVHQFFLQIENNLSESIDIHDILLSDVDYNEWNIKLDIKFDVNAFYMPDEEEKDADETSVKTTLWHVFDTFSREELKDIPCNRTDNVQLLMGVLMNDLSADQLTIVLNESIVALRENLLHIHACISRHRMNVGECEELYRHEREVFIKGYECKVIEEFEYWKEYSCDGDEAVIKRNLKGKYCTEILNFFMSNFLAPRISAQTETDTTEFDAEFEELRFFNVPQNIEAKSYYSALRELFKYKNGIVVPIEGNIGKYFFRHRKEVDAKQRIALFAFIKMIELIEEEKKPKAMVDEVVNYEGIKVAMIRTYFPKCTSALTKKYNAEWLDSYMTALMDSKHKDAIAAEWNNATTRKQVYCAILGALKDKGVFKITYAALARMIYDGNIEDETNEKKKKQMIKDLRTLEKYIGNGKKHIIGKWTATYEK